MPKKNTGYRLKWRQERDQWEIVWFEQSRRKRLSTGTANRKEADKLLAKHIATAERRADTRLVGDVLTDYQSEHAPYTAAPKRIAYCILNLSPFFGDLKTEEVTKAKCKEYALKREAKNGTIRKELVILRAALNHDRKEGRITHTPYIWMPKGADPKDRWLTRKEAADLIKAARVNANHLPWFILISLYSGQRKMAVLNLTWDRVDLQRGLINWQYGKETNKRRPKQPMPDELKMFLGYLSRYGTRGFVLNRGGKGIQDIRRGLSAALKRANIDGCTPHTLKHTAITWLLQNGTDIWSVAGFTGTSVKTLESIYGHHCPDYMEKARISHKMARKRRAAGLPGSGFTL